MAKWIGDGDISESSQSRSKQLLFWILAGIGGLLVLFLLGRLAFRLNHKMSDARQGFVKVIGWLILGAIVLCVAFALLAGVFRLISKKRYIDEDIEQETED